MAAIILLVMMPIFVTMYTLSFLRIRRFVAENPIYQNRGEADSNESPEYLKELFNPNMAGGGHKVPVAN